MGAHEDTRMADRVSAWAAGVGVGLIALMLTWLVGGRVAALLWERPVAPIVAFVGAIVVGVAVAAWWAVRLDRRVRG